MGFDSYTIRDAREVDESAELIKLDENKNHEDVKLSGCAVAEVIKGDLMRLDLHLATLVGQGYDGASAMSSERVGEAANIKEAAPLADYYHRAMYALNLSCVRDQYSACTRRNQGRDKVFPER
jgi:hypothetical protein